MTLQFNFKFTELISSDSLIIVFVERFAISGFPIYLGLFFLNNFCVLSLRAINFNLARKAKSASEKRIAADGIFLFAPTLPTSRLTLMSRARCEGEPARIKKATSRLVDWLHLKGSKRGVHLSCAQSYID